jgi:hypothetical protein
LQNSEWRRETGRTTFYCHILDPFCTQVSV